MHDASREPTPRTRLASAITRPFSSLHGNRGFTALFASNLLFFSGTWTVTFILGWVVFEQTRSELLVAVFTTVRMLPLLLGPLAGVLSDRMDRRLLLNIAGAVAMTAVALLALLSTLGFAPYLVLVAGGLLLGLAQSPSQPARSALVVELVPASQLSNANALNSLAFNITLMVGPAIGGIAVNLLGSAAALWFAVAWFVASQVVLRWVPVTHTPPEVPHESMGRMLIGGLRGVLRYRVVGAVLLVTIVTNAMLWAIYAGFMPVFAGSIGLDAAGLGALLTSYGIGGITGALVVASLGDFRYKGAVFVCGTALMAALWVVFALLGSSPLIFVVLPLAGFVSSTFGVLQNTLMLAGTPKALQGRAMGLQELAIGAQPLAALVIGASAEAIGIGLTTAISAGMLIAFLAAVALIVPELMRYHATAHDPRPDPLPAG